MTTPNYDNPCSKGLISWYTRAFFQLVEPDPPHAPVLNPRFAFSMSICLFCCFLLKKLMGHLAEGSLNFLSFEVVFNTRIDASALKDYLDTKDLAVSDGQLGQGGSLTKSAVWDEDDEAFERSVVAWHAAPAQGFA